MRFLRPVYQALISATLLQPIAAFAAKPIESLPHVGKWVAQFDDNACHLVGQFGTGKEAVTLQMTRYGPGQGFDLKLYGERLRAGDLIKLGGVTFTPDAKIHRKNVVIGHAEKLPMALFGVNRLDNWIKSKEADVGPSISPEAERAVSSIDVEFGSARRFRLLTGSMGKPMSVMRTCMHGLIKHWGFDPDVQEKLQQRPVPTRSPHNWLKSDDYPLGALDRGFSGVVHFRLDVDALGKVERCHILAVTKPSDFELATCNGVTKRARFSPALDAEGRPVRSFYVDTVRWLAAI